MPHADIIIVGGGHAGAQVAIGLRQRGFAGTITLIGREPELPYERPPLSKEYFAREKSFERLHIRPAAFWQDKAVQMLLGRAVVAFDPLAHQLDLDDGTALTYGSLVWATGGDARQLACPGADLSGIHTIRTRADCDQLMGEIDSGLRRIAVIGGGYIGLEAAAVLRKAGCDVTVLEAGERVLARVAGPALSAFYEAEHRAQGVDVRTRVTVEGLEGVDRVTGVRLIGGEIVAADTVIVGIGIVPAIEPLAAAGAEIAPGGGVLVDEYGRTSLPDVFGVGDCTAFACSFAQGAVMRVESVQNANDQANCVVKALCGTPEPYHSIPWFWSNQYDLRLQTAGLSLGYDQTVLRGDPETRSFSVVYLRGGKVIALDCVNAVKDYVQGRKLVERGASLDPACIANVSLSLKDMVA